MTVAVEGVATGGEGVARAPDGRVLFVPGALPGERVEVEITDVRRRHGRARLIAVVEASGHRVDPPCPHVGAGCGGCDWQHVDATLADALRLRIVADALERIGGLRSAPVEAAPPIASEGRTTVRAAVTDGRAGFRRRRSHDVLTVDSCRVAHPLVEEVLVDGRFGAADEVVIRVGARTGDRMVVLDPAADGRVTVPDDVAVVSRADPASDAVLHEDIAGRRWRVSARSFLQPSPEAADALVAEVGAAIDQVAGRSGRLIDLAAGIGLFAGSVADGFDDVVAVERAPSAVADARVNLPSGVQVEEVRFERWGPRPAGCVVADPPRAGLDRDGVDRVAATGAPVVVLVSCDAAALGRDAGLLVGAGYRLERCRVLDLFPGTSRVEVVSAFRLG